MYSQTDIELARLALYAYDYSPRNHSGIPEGYTLVEGSEFSDEVTGFQAYAFIGPGDQLVVAFTGTRFAEGEPLDVDWQSNITGALGSEEPFGTGQFEQAVLWFKRLMDNPDISDASKQDVMFTGHSLGGGLAEFMGTIFGLPAVGFAPAPFEQIALNTDTMIDLLAGFGAHTTHGAALASWVHALQQGGEVLSQTLDAREGNISSIAITDEMVTLPLRLGETFFDVAGVLVGTTLNYVGPAAAAALLMMDSFQHLRPLAPWLMATAIPGVDDAIAGSLMSTKPEELYLGESNYRWIDVGEWSNLNVDLEPLSLDFSQAVAKHAMSWHLALMESEELLQAVAALPDLAPIISSSDYFARDAYQDRETDLLLKILNNHFGVFSGGGDDQGVQPRPASGWLIPFAADMLAISEAVPAGSESHVISGLIAVAAQYYADSPDGAIDPLFAAVSGGLSFDLDEIPGASPSSVKGIARHLWGVLADDFDGAAYLMPALHDVDAMQAAGSACGTSSTAPTA